MSAKVAARDTVLPRGGGPDGKSPIFVPKGRKVFWSSHSMHRRKDIWGQDADEFRPERWESARPSWVSLLQHGTWATSLSLNHKSLKLHCTGIRAFQWRTSDVSWSTVCNHRSTLCNCTLRARVRHHRSSRQYAVDRGSRFDGDSSLREGRSPETTLDMSPLWCFKYRIYWSAFWSFGSYRQSRRGGVRICNVFALHSDRLRKIVITLMSVCQPRYACIAIVQNPFPSDKPQLSLRPSAFFLYASGQTSPFVMFSFFLFIQPKLPASS